LPGDLNAPKNIGEEFRRNTSVMCYAFDANFYGYFGPEGAAGVGKAFAILNALTNVDNYSKNLSEFPVETRHQNYQAQALGLLDLKSTTLGLMAEQLGLADPIRYTWNLHDRYHVGDVACPVGMEYLVVQRNFDIVPSSLTQLQYSPYVNGVLYSYQILEWCEVKNSFLKPALAIASPYSADPLADTYSPVASSYLGLGDFYTGFTRDDMAGLRYLLTTNNVNWESSAPDSLQVVTNTSVQQLFPVFGSGGTNASGGGWYNVVDGITYGTASYPALLNFAQTNNPANLQAAYPGLQFTLVSNYLAVVMVTNTISYYTNIPGAPVPSLVIKKVRQQAIQEYFTYQFDNIITNLYSKTTKAKIQTLKVAPLVGAPVGSPSVTNVSTKTVTLNIPNGEFYILPTNSPCGVDIIATLITYTNYMTNVITSTTSITNTVANTTTNATASTNNAYSYTQIQIIPSIGHVYAIHPVTCDSTNQSTGLMRGIGRISYIHADYDSMLGQLWYPVTNDYSMTMISNSRPVKLSFRRIITQPDFLFTAQDMVSGPDAVPVVPGVARNLNFDEANVLQGLAGPGTITTPTVFTFNKAGPVFYNYYGGVMDGTPYFNQNSGIGNIGAYFVWANFDGSTNDPVVFPNGTSLENLQNQMVIQVSPVPDDMPLGTVGVNYALNPPGKFVATGGAFTEPYKWSDPAGVLSGIGLSLAEDGTLSGVPVQDGTFDFTLKLTDAAGRTVNWNYTIIIQPNIGG
jgi:hypothetical protein